MQTPRLSRITDAGLAISCALVVCAACSAANASDLEKQVPDKQYEGEALAVWERRAADVDPKSAYAAELVPALTEIIKDDLVPGTTRGRLAITLGRIGKPAAPAVPILAEVLGDPSEPISNRVWAGRALGLLGEHASPAAGVLIDFLFDEQIPAALRQVPVEALAMIGSRHPDVLPALIELFQYASASDSGLKTGEVTAMRELAAEAFALLKTDADVAVPLLSRAIRNPAEAECIRRKSLIALGQIGANAAVAVPAILESLEFDPSDAARDEAARALARIGDDAHVMMKRYLAHPEANVRWRIAAAVGEIEFPSSDMLAALRRAASDDSEVVRLAAVESLGHLKDDRDVFIPATIQLLTSKDRQIRMPAMRLILSRQPLDAKEITMIEELVNHEDRDTSRIARLVLRKLTADTTE